MSTQAPNTTDLLKAIVSGGFSVNKDKKIVITGNKLSNDFLSHLIKTMRSTSNKLDEKQIVDAILLLDSYVEQGKMDEDYFKNKWKDPDQIN